MDWRPEDILRRPGWSKRAVRSDRADTEGVLSGLLLTVMLCQCALSILAIGALSSEVLELLLATGGAILACAVAALVFRRQSDSRLRDQAARIYIHTERTRNDDGSLTVVARVYNSSELPIWHVEVRPRRDGEPYLADLSQRLPDLLPEMVEQWSWKVEREFAPHEERYPELVFLDSNQRHWRRIGVSLELLPT
ncbi:MAG TPA: hypothetical protein VFJ53_05365 [Solirubrobacterales bacterium]|nr:hypothetical protein [Solirubrobacterales bacterium]